MPVHALVEETPQFLDEPLGRLNAAHMADLGHDD